MGNNVINNGKQIKMPRINSSDLIISLIVLIAFNFNFFLSLLDTSNLSPLVVSSFYVIGLISLSVLCFAPHFISIIKVCFTFIFIFLYYAPFLQYIKGVNLWNHITLNDSDYIYGNMLIIISIFLILLFYFFTLNKKNKYENPKTYCITNTTKVVFLIIDVIVLLYFIATNGIVGRESESTDTIFSSIQKIIRFFPISTLMLFIYNNNINNKKVDNFYLTVNALIVFVLFFPFAGSLPRFMLLGSYLILACFFLKRVKSRSLLVLFVILGFQYIFPAFNFFKSHTIFEIGSFKFSSDSFNSVDFDAYQMFLESIRYTRIEGYTYGKNILSSILFFVPRSLWNAKSCASGELVSTFFGAWFTNISCPFWGEAYLAGGSFVLILFSCIFGCFIKLMEKWFFSKNIFRLGVSSIVFGMLIYWLRGSMLPTTAYSAALIISFSLSYLLGKVFFYHSKKMGA